MKQNHGDDSDCILEMQECEMSISKRGWLGHWVSESGVCSKV